MHADSKLPRRKRLIVGEVFASSHDIELSTVVGSCVTVCLYEPIAKCGGMNHFLLPTASSAGNTTAGATYGDVAMEKLLLSMRELRADRRHLQAKVFGAANALRMSHARSTVGEKNRNFIFEYLKAARIPVIAMRVGGNQGLSVHFFCKTGQAYIRPVDPAAEYDMQGYEGVHT